MTLRLTLGLIIYALVSSCQMLKNKEEKITMLDIQGHRGCRGLMPENTIPAFIKALEIGVNTLEMDVVITKDLKVLLSHEPFLSHEICYSPTGKSITEEEEKSYNLYQMTYEEISKCDCGSKPHPRFPEQEHMPLHKPLLEDVIDSVEQYLQQHNLPPVQYNIETKCTPHGDNIFHPGPEAFLDLLVEVIRKKGISERCIIQSFDVRTLQFARQKYPDLKLALLIENDLSPEENIYRLGFFPHIYSPEFILVDKKLMAYARLHHMQVIPWTVNEEAHILKILKYNVDGIISDYPDRVVRLVKQEAQE